MKVLVISGFLGAGKTTFLKALARRTGKDFAVMENEYGQVNIDGDVLNQGEEKLSIWELTEGCICCSRKSDFAASVLTIANTVDPEYLIVEPTGVGMLSSVLGSIQKVQYEKIQILSPVTVLDGHAFDRYLKEFPEICMDQIRHAGTIVVSKMESASREELLLLEERIRKISPQAKICSHPYNDNPDPWFLSLLSEGLHGPLPAAADADSGLESLGLTDVSLPCPDALLLLLNGLTSGLFGNVVRAKGALQAGTSWLRFDLSDRSYSITGCEPQKESKAIFIGTDLKRAWLRELLQQEITVTAFRAPRRAGKRL